MGANRPCRRSEVGAGALKATSLPTVVRVRPDVAAVRRTFDYEVPATWRAGSDIELAVGSRVRVELHGRRVGGWIIELDPPPVAGIDLRPLQKWSGHGPPGALIELCDWVAHRWLGAPAKALRTASPPKNVYRLPPAQRVRWTGDVADWASAAFAGRGSIVRLAPAADRWPLVLAAASLGNPLLLVPTIDEATSLAARLRRAGLPVAQMPDDWAHAASGAIVVGTRSAALAPAHDPGAIVVFDEHDDAYREERAPTWHAREVAVERAARAGVPCVLVSPVPSAEAIRHVRLIEPDRTVEHAGWPTIEVIDRRSEPPGRLGLFSAELARLLDGDGRIACVLNRVGRVRLLACVACGELTRCDVCGAAVRQVEDRTLRCPRCDAARPPVCAVCRGARLKNVVLGIGRARQELSALIGEEVGEVTASTMTLADARVVIGTEAVLRMPRSRSGPWSCVVFLDFDQHLTALRQNAEAEAMALLALAARHVGPRRAGRRVVVQTRLAEHRVLESARRGDPGPLTQALLDQAVEMGWPPAIAQAEVSGPGAAAYVERLGAPLDLRILGPNDDRWLIRAPTVELLLARLADVERGDDRLRIAVS